MRHGTIGLALLLAAVFGFAGAAQATSFNLGNISGPGQFAFGNNKFVRPFTDKVHFTINPGVTLTFSAFVSTGFARRSHILDMDGTLSDDSGVILDGDAFTVMPEGFPDRHVKFQNTVLGPGHYYLSIFGTATSTNPGPMSRAYAGTITFTPLPASLLFMLTALCGLGIFGRHRAKQTAA